MFSFTTVSLRCVDTANLVSRVELNKFQRTPERCWLDRMWRQSLEMTAMASQFDQYSDEIFACYGSALWQELADKKGLFLTKKQEFLCRDNHSDVWEGFQQSSAGGAIDTL